MTRVRLVGDHSSYHCGGAAAWEVISGWAARQNLEQVQGQDEFDILVVNGEGSMHHGRPTFHRKMRELEAAVSRNKATYLVNTVWHNNPNDYDEVLAKLAGVYVRDSLSFVDLLENHGRTSHRSVDLSYFAAEHRVTEAPDFAGRAVRTDYLSAAIGDFVDMTHPELTPLPIHSLKANSWSSYIAGLRTASLLITGRHHAVYAACRARTPFAAVEGNSHKIRGIIHSAQVSIPIASSQDHLPDLSEWALHNHDEFERLFDWMEFSAANGPDGFALPSL